MNSYMKKIKIVIVLLIAHFFTSSAFAQNDAFFVNTASKAKKWEFVKAEFDKYKFGEAVLKKVEKKFGVATSINIDKDASFMWNVTTTEGNTTSTGTITEAGDDNFFEFYGGEKLKVNVSFKNYDTEMCLTIYCWEKDEYVNLIYKKQ